MRRLKSIPYIEFTAEGQTRYLYWFSGAKHNKYNYCNVINGIGRQKGYRRTDFNKLEKAEWDVLLKLSQDKHFDDLTAKILEWKEYLYGMGEW